MTLISLDQCDISSALLHISSVSSSSKKKTQRKKEKNKQTNKQTKKTGTDMVKPTELKKKR